MKVKRLAALLLALCLAFSLAGCGVSGEDIQLLVQGNIDQIYLGRWSDEYLVMVDSDTASLEQGYEEGLEVEAEVFITYFSIEYPTDELRAQIVNLYKEIYSHSKYEVGEPAVIDDETWGVPVTVYPMNIMEQVSDASEEAIAELQANYTAEDVATEEGYMAYDAAWAQMFIDLCYEKLDTLGYLEPEEMVIQVALNSDDYWQIAENDFQRLDAAMIYYP